MEQSTTTTGMTNSEIVAGLDQAERRWEALMAAPLLGSPEEHARVRAEVAATSAEITRLERLVLERGL